MRTARVLRVFTRDGEGGNHLGVVTDLDGLDETSMQAIAAELGYSETIFLDPPRIRIFTPTAELQFAGHPLVGAAWVLAQDGAESGTLQPGIGLVEWRADATATWVQTDLPDGPVPLADAAVRAEGMRLPVPESAWMVAVPQPYTIFLVEDAEVTAADPDLEAVAASAAEVYLFSRSGDHVHARFFAPGLGVPEDPATGSAAVALASVLNLTDGPRGEVTIHQGEEMGQPCEIRLRWEAGRAAIGGGVVEDAPRQVAGGTR